jgi:hypothetical protein
MLMIVAPPPPVPTFTVVTAAPVARFTVVVEAPVARFAVTAAASGQSERTACVPSIEDSAAWSAASLYRSESAVPESTRSTLT